MLFHQGKALSHLAHKISKYLEKLRKKNSIDYQRKEHVAVKGADCSPMNFSALGGLSIKSKRRKSRVGSRFGSRFAKRLLDVRTLR